MICKIRKVVHKDTKRTYNNLTSCYAFFSELGFCYILDIMRYCKFFDYYDRIQIDIHIEPYISFLPVLYDPVKFSKFRG